jgi:hypothetical protein
MSFQPYIQETITLYWFFPKQEMKLYHSVIIHMQETSLQSFSVHCSAESEERTNSFISPFPKVSTVATQCYVPFPLLVAK